MKTFIQIFFISFFIMFFQGCQGQNQNASDSWPGEVLQMPEGISAADLPAPNSEGAQLTAEFCSQCHGIPSPASHSASDWVPVFRRMMLRAERMQHMGSMMGGNMGNMMGGRMRERMHNVFIPSYEEKTVILSYLQDHALKSISPNEIPNTETTGAKLFQQKCSRCHALPDPNVHTASQWPDVVARMQLNTKKANLPELKKDEQDTIVKYLEKNAKKQ